MQSSSAIVFIVPALLILTLLILLRMQTRRFYFIRHGETLLNAKRIRQGAEGSLSPKGRDQADQVGKYLKHMPIKRIISSPYIRAKETASIINKYFHVPITYSPLLVERRNPSEIIGKSTHDPDVIHIVDQMDLSYHSDEYRLSDEENFIEERDRAKKFIGLLTRQGTGDVLIVTHHHILKMIIAYTLYRKRLHAKDFIKLTFFNTSDNASITVCEYHPWKMFSATRGWEIISYNQQPDIQ